MLLEAVSKLSATALGSEVRYIKAPCAENTGGLYAHGNDAGADVGAQPKGPGLFFEFVCYSSFIHTQVFLSTPALNCEKTAPGAVADNIETAS
jgi:hypothetical protein